MAAADYFKRAESLLDQHELTDQEKEFVREQRSKVWLQVCDDLFDAQKTRALRSAVLIALFENLRIGAEDFDANHP